MIKKRKELGTLGAKDSRTDGPVWRQLIVEYIIDSCSCGLNVQNKFRSGLMQLVGKKERNK